MQGSVTITRDTISPTVKRMARRFKDRRPILQSMGTALVSVTQRAFSSPSLRPKPWKPVKRAGSPLRKSNALWKSIRIVRVNNRMCVVGTDRAYAAFHQFGTGPYVIRPRAKKALFWPGAKHPVKKVNHPGLPARPFFPFDRGGRMTSAGQTRVERAAINRMKKMAEQAGA